MVRLLLEHRTDVNMMDNYGQTALYLVATKEDEAVVRLLLEHKADVSTMDRFGRTALHQAAGYDEFCVGMLGCGSKFIWAHRVCVGTPCLCGHTVFVLVLR
jgi:ankyrin repeat protein